MYNLHKILHMVRNGHLLYQTAYGTIWSYNVSICIWYEMAMVRNGYGTKWQWYEMVMIRKWFSLWYEMVMVRNDCNSFYLVEETGGSGENHRPVASHWQALSHTGLPLFWNQREKWLLFQVLTKEKWETNREKWWEYREKSKYFSN